MPKKKDPNKKAKQEKMLLLVNTPGKGAGDLSKADESMYPYSLFFLLSYLHKNNYFNCRILDLSLSMCLKDDLKKYLKSRKFNVIGFTATTANRFSVVDLFKVVKEVIPESIILAGGNHFTYTAGQALDRIPELDIVVRGEGEVTLLELMTAIESGADLSNVRGISWRRHNKIIHSDERPVETDLDKLNIDEDLVDYIDLPHGKYSPFMLLRNFEDEFVKAIPIHAGRGCPGSCVFCLHNKKKYRTRSIESLIKEIKEKKEKYRCDVFHLEDPFLLKRKEFIIGLCERLIREGINIKWWAESRFDIDLSLIKLLAKAGCISLDFGLESASEIVQSNIKKNISIKHAQKIIDECYRNKIRVSLFLMVSLPGETEQDALKTLDFVKGNIGKIHSITGGVTIIYPGSEIEILAKKKGILPVDFNWYDRDYRSMLPHSANPSLPVWIEHLSPEFIDLFMKEMYAIITSRKPYFRGTGDRFFKLLFESEPITHKAVRMYEWIKISKNILIYKVRRFISGQRAWTR